MDPRVHVQKLLGVRQHDVHIIRNAGGVVTNDVLRSLVVSQRVLRTHGIVIIGHTDCGMQRMDREAVKAELESETGVALPFDLRGFDDVAQAVRESMERVVDIPFLKHRNRLRGFVFDVDTGEMTEIHRDDKKASGNSEEQVA